MAKADAKNAPSTVADEKVKKAEALLNYDKDKVKGSMDYYKNVYVPQYFTKKDRSGVKDLAAPTDAEIASARATWGLGKSLCG